MRTEPGGGGERGSREGGMDERWKRTQRKGSTRVCVCARAYVRVRTSGGSVACTCVKQCVE